jgi:two-component system, chemotaxis family, sensor kinase CheA
VARAGVTDVNGRPAVLLEGIPVPLTTLDQVAGPPFATALAGPVLSVAVLNGERPVGLVVDELLGVEEVVLRPVAGAGRRLVSGGARLAGGRVAPVLNVPELAEAGWGTAPLPGVGDAAPARRARILVVDDSITTRTLEQSVLEAAGYEVDTAVDGADAWRRLQDAGADLVVADVDMPRMDGFALCEAIRASRRFRDLPVILVTALEEAESRARGLEAGASAYLGKSGFDQEGLLGIVRQLLGEGGA